MDTHKSQAIIKNNKELLTILDKCKAIDQHKKK